MNGLKLKITAGVICIAAGFLCLAGFSQVQPDGKQPEASSAITAFPIQLGRDSYGLAMVDIENETVWIYGFNARGQAFDQLRLMAARSFKHDRKLTEWNTATPTPTQVKVMLENLQSQQTQKEQKQQQKIEELQQLLEQN
jgi:hypothetical protein